ncbi:hypothetical protein GA0061093_1514 [Rhodococcus qingshengii]|jgi:hypothetical protein|nr:hypothetical protein GA0061093_1514 [Rhodococcus qingshengii]
MPYAGQSSRSDAGPPKRNHVDGTDGDSGLDIERQLCASPTSIAPQATKTVVVLLPSTSEHGLEPSRGKQDYRRTARHPRSSDPRRPIAHRSLAHAMHAFMRRAVRQLPRPGRGGSTQGEQRRTADGPALKPPREHGDHGWQIAAIERSKLAEAAIDISRPGRRLGRSFRSFARPRTPDLGD